MQLTQRLSTLKHTLGDRRAIRAKLSNAWRTTATVLDRRERDARIARLIDAGSVERRPTEWQLLLGAWHMMFGYILPSNKEFYEHYEVGHWWHQLIRVLDDPSIMLDPIGLGISQEVLITHLIQVVHSSAGYDVVLLQMFDGGLASLREQLVAVQQGTHPRQATIESLVENPDYPAQLLAALDRFEADPETHWRVDTLPAPQGCEARFDWGIETFGTPGRLFAYSCGLPPTAGASLRAWIRGELRVPSPPQAIAS